MSQQQHPYVPVATSEGVAHIEEDLKARHLPTGSNHASNPPHAGGYGTWHEPGVVPAQPAPPVIVYQDNQSKDLCLYFMCGCLIFWVIFIILIVVLVIVYEETDDDYRGR